MGKRRRSAIFRNDQWEVTHFGIASLTTGAPCRYEIDAERLLATDSFDGRQLYVWPIHVVRLPWVKPVLFFEAFSAAIEAHEGQYSETVDLALLEASVAESLRDISGQIGRGGDTPA
jgi:hypothetical protein